jgi:hypothetical protein
LPYSSPGRCAAREYFDSGDFAGLLRRFFDGAMAFIQRIEHKPPPDVLGVYVYLPGGVTPVEPPRRFLCVGHPESRIGIDCDCMSAS